MAVRFRIHENRTAVLAGVDYNDLRSVFDGAAIHYYDEVRQLRKLGDRRKLTAQERGRLAFNEHQIKVLDMIKAATDAGIAATFPPRPERALTKAERWAAVRERKAERELFDQLHAAVMAEARRKAGT